MACLADFLSILSLSSTKVVIFHALPLKDFVSSCKYRTIFEIFYFSLSTAEEMACLATWKEGSSRYFVSMLNHSHVYTDETRYRCFVYQRQHSASNELGRVTYKMAQSLYASCLGLWNVNEGHRTFTMTKRNHSFIYLFYMYIFSYNEF